MTTRTFQNTVKHITRQRHGTTHDPDSVTNACTYAADGHKSSVLKCYMQLEAPEVLSGMLELYSLLATASQQNAAVRRSEHMRGATQTARCVQPLHLAPVHTGGPGARNSGSKSSTRARERRPSPCQGMLDGAVPLAPRFFTAWGGVPKSKGGVFGCFGHLLKLRNTSRLILESS